jgi:hypothetical protein
VKRPVDIRRAVNENQVWGIGHGIGQRGGRLSITDPRPVSGTGSIDGASRRHRHGGDILRTPIAAFGTKLAGRTAHAIGGSDSFVRTDAGARRARGSCWPSATVVNACARYAL